MVLEALLEDLVDGLQVLRDRYAVGVLPHDAHRHAGAGGDLLALRHRAGHVQPGAAAGVAGVGQPALLRGVVGEGGGVEPGLRYAAQPRQGDRRALGPGVEHRRHRRRVLDLPIDDEGDHGPSTGPVLDDDPGPQRAGLVYRDDLAARPRRLPDDDGLHRHRIDLAVTDPRPLVESAQFDEPRQVGLLRGPQGPTVGEGRSSHPTTVAEGAAWRSVSGSVIRWATRSVTRSVPGPVITTARS